MQQNFFQAFLKKIRFEILEKMYRQNSTKICCTARFLMESAKSRKVVVYLTSLIFQHIAKFFQAFDLRLYTSEC